MSNNKNDLFIFISYNSTDHKFVLRLAEALTARDLTVFLDCWELVPGKPWPETLEQHLGNCGAAAILLGRSPCPPRDSRVSTNVGVIHIGHPTCCEFTNRPQWAWLGNRYFAR